MSTLAARLKRRAAMALLWLLTAGPAHAANGFDEFVADVYRLFNAARLAAGVTADVVEPGLQGSAEAHALDMAHHGCFTDTRCDGPLSWDACLRSHCLNDGNPADIVVGDFSSPSEVVSAWLADTFGQALILGAAYKAIGLGWTSVPGLSGHRQQLNVSPCLSTRGEDPCQTAPKPADPPLQRRSRS